MGTHKNRLIENEAVYEAVYEAVLMSTHNLCFRAKIRKKCIPLYTKVYYIKVGCKGVFITRTCLHDVNSKLQASSKVL